METKLVLQGFVPSPAASTVPVEAIADAPVLDVPLPDVPVEGSMEVIVVDELLNRIIEIVGMPDETPNFIETPFAEYSTTDGLLLILIVVSFFSLLWSIVKGV